MTYNELLERIEHKEYATAGCSLKHFILSANMIDWIEDNINDNLDFSKYEQETFKCLVELKPAAYAFFVQSFQDTYDEAEMMILNPKDREIIGLSESSGHPLKSKRPSIDKLKAFYKFVQSCENQVIKEEFKISDMQMGLGPEYLQQEFEAKKKQRD